MIHYAHTLNFEAEEGSWSPWWKKLFRKKNLMTVTLYSKPRCSQCEATKTWLQNNHVAYQQLPAEAYVDHLKALGHRTAPVVTLSGPGGVIEDHWAGFRIDRLKTLKQKANA